MVKHIILWTLNPELSDEQKEEVDEAEEDIDEEDEEKKLEESLKSYRRANHRLFNN